MATEKQLLDLKTKALEIRDTIIQSKATYAEVIKNIEGYEKELKELGVEPDKAEEKISELDTEINDIYTKASDIIKQWYK